VNERAVNIKQNQSHHREKLPEYGIFTRYFRMVSVRISKAENYQQARAGSRMAGFGPAPGL